MTQLVCVVERRGKFSVAEPLFEPGPQLPLRRGSVRPTSGEMVLVEAENGGARPLRELGSPKVARDVVEAMLADQGIERGFRPAVETEASEVEQMDQVVRKTLILRVFPRLTSSNKWSITEWRQKELCANKRSCCLKDIAIKGHYRRRSASGCSVFFRAETEI